MHPTMLTTDLGACEWFVWDLRRSNLIDRGQLDMVIGEFLTKNPGAEPPQLAEFLVQKSYLTDFQAERLLQGKTQGFVLGPFTLMDALATAEGLDAAHQANLFHGMLKPSNIMIGADGQIKILDFGIGCLLSETEGESLVDTMSTANSVNSGLDCASPESIMDPSNLNAIGDQYSLGCVLYYCLSGQYPFPDGTAGQKMMCPRHK